VVVEESWSIAPVDTAQARRLAADLGVSPLVAEVLVRRGFGEAEAARTFLQPDFRLRDPFLIDGMEAARARIDRALGAGERIAVYGDYDVDGITATFVLVEALRSLGGDVVWRLPNRFTDGYGVSADAVEMLAAEGARLLITVDCGVGARDEVDLAHGLGVDVIVTDHHEPVGELPDCTVVDPRLGDYPFPHLAGVGVAFKLAHALLLEQREERLDVPLALRPLVDVVAVGTVADVVPLRDENRALVAMGLGRLASAPRPGLAALLQVSGVEPASIDATTISFRLAPRLNAAGRLEDASLALELLGAPDVPSALPLAQRLGELNTARQELEARALREALAMVPDPVPAALVLSSPDWHEGVVGIVAARVAERVNRPAILLTEGDETAKGSGRSIATFDLLAAVDACSESLLSFGGHRAACGVRLRRDDIARFRRAFTAFALATLSADDLRRVTVVDAVASGDDLTLTTADDLALFQPHGTGNPRITLLLPGAQIRRPRLTRGGKHLQCDVHLDGVTHSAIRFGFNARDSLSDTARYDVPAILSRNSFNGVVSAQLELRGGAERGAAPDDLCPTACAGECPDRVRADAFWTAIQTLGRRVDGEPASAAAEALRRDGRLVDHRRRPVISTLTKLAAAGGRLLLLVADVGRRRPLLTHDLYLPQIAGSRLYLNGACAAGRLGLAVAPQAGAPAATSGAAPRGRSGRESAVTELVMASFVTAALHPELVAAFDRIAFLDPPFDAVTYEAVVGAAGRTAEVHIVWGDDALHFSQRVAAAEYDLEAACRRVYRILATPSRQRDGADLAEALLPSNAGLAKLPVLAAALQVLDEIGLLTTDGGDRAAGVQVRPGSIDLHDSPTYTAWHARHTQSRFLETCLTTSV
jgi:single-stranded-DNA-specific exonuclease